ncbi:DMT family transporter [Roseibium suaedae]|uniref:DMT family transporter n=1 Tax=Roseibium suaedae TaxID=735517 RepID=UPI0009346ABA|nr:DMT family transporter [Roseibium suaedae]
MRSFRRRPAGQAAGQAWRWADRGVLFALSALFCGVASSVFLKSVSALPGGQAIAIRSAFALVLLLAVIAVRSLKGSGARLGKTGCVRAVLDATAGLAFAYAVFELPLGLLASIHATLPLVSVALAAILLREPLSRRVLLAIVMGAAGVLVILQPGLEASPLGLALALLSLFAYALRDLVTRRMEAGGDLVKSVALSAFLIGLAGLLTGATISPPPLVPGDFVLLGLAAVTFLGANTMIIAAFRRAPVARIAPLRYSSILWALLFDAILWGHMPEPATWFGIAIILAAGSVLLLRPGHISGRQ